MKHWHLEYIDSTFLSESCALFLELYSLFQPVASQSYICLFLFFNLCVARRPTTLQYSSVGGEVDPCLSRMAGFVRGDIFVDTYLSRIGCDTRERRKQKQILFRPALCRDFRRQKGKENNERDCEPDF